MHKRLLIIIINMFFSFALAEESKVPWLERKSEGWAWFEDLKQKDQEDKKEEAILEPPPIPKPEKTEEEPEKKLTEREKLAEIRKDLEEKLARAILFPSSKNVEAYMRAQLAMVEKGESFATAWQGVLLSHPELDNTIANPVSQYGLNLYKKVMRENKDQKLKELGRKYILLFLYEGGNEFSKSFAGIVLEFCKRYDWKVLGVSLDNQIFAKFPSLPPNNKLMGLFSIKYTPAVILLDPKTEETIPAGWGMLALSQLEDNIIQQTEKKESFNEVP